MLCPFSSLSGLRAFRTVHVQWQSYDDLARSLLGGDIHDRGDVVRDAPAAPQRGEWSGRARGPLADRDADPTLTKIDPYHPAGEVSRPVVGHEGQTGGGVGEGKSAAGVSVADGVSVGPVVSVGSGFAVEASEGDGVVAGAVGGEPFR